MTDVSADPGTGTVRVLIVDDQAPFRSAARMVVEVVDGFEVVGEAETGEAGVRLAGELVPDLILMDVNLPGIDGLEATRRIRVATPPSVVLVLSTYGRDDYEDQAIAAGAAAFIPKGEFDPFSLEDAWRGAGELA